MDSLTHPPPPRKALTAADFVSKLGPDAKATKTAQGWQCRCPAHADNSPSLSVSQGSGGQVLIHDHAGCTPEAICAAVGLTLADLMPPRPERNGKFNIVAAYDYTDETGKLLFQVCRLDPKDFRQRRPDPTAKDGWAWTVKGIRPVPYRLPELLAGLKNGFAAYVCEGEKDCDAMHRAGLVATCNAAGAGKWKPEFAEHFKGALVFIIADKDEAGRKHAAQVAANLAPVASRVCVVELPDLPGKPVKDAADFLAAGGTGGDILGLASNAPPWPPPAAPVAESDPGEPEPTWARPTVAAVETVAPGEADPPPVKVLPPVIGRPLSTLVRHDGHDPDQLLRHRFLCRLAILLVCGPTGIGKSALAMQMMILWALGKPCFGITPARPLKSVLIQGENDDGDLAEMRDGVIAGLHLTEAEARQAMANVIVWREDQRTGFLFFCEVARPLLGAHKPDLLWIDPALCYLGGETSSQKDVGGFLRNMLNPLLREFNCAAVVIHHTNKPPSGTEKPDWKAGDFAYLGSGSAEWANASRAVLALRSIGSHEVFELRAGKRGARLGWQGADGTKSFSKYLAHATEPGIICWREVDPEDLDKGGRPTRHDEDDLFSLLPSGGLTTTEWKEKADTESGISRTSFYRLKKVLQAQKRITQSVTSDKWQPLKKP